MPNFINREHLGGYIASDLENPHGDTCTYSNEVWEFLVERFKPQRVLDVGCGEGHFVKWCLDRGAYCVGIDAVPEIWKAGIVPQDHLIYHDYTTGPFRTSPVDLIWCCEFVEHVEERYTENFLSTFDNARVVAMTHAYPGQHGHHHVNCQLPEYWIDKMYARGFELDFAATQASHERSSKWTHWTRSGMIFVKGPRLDSPNASG